MKIKKLTEVEMICLANIVLIDVNRLKKIYYEFGIDGVNIIACNDVFFIINGIKAAKIKDLFRIASMYNASNGNRIVRELFKGNVYKRRGSFYYSQIQLDVVGYPKCNIVDDIKHYCDIRDDGYLILPNSGMLSRTHYLRIYQRLFRKLNDRLPLHIEQKLYGLPKMMDMINVECCFRVLNLYLSLDPSVIGMKKFIDRQLHVSKKSPEMLRKLIDESGIWTCDDKTNIIYDPELRVSKGLSRVPDKIEVAYAKERNNGRLWNILIEY